MKDVNAGTNAIERWHLLLLDSIVSAGKLSDKNNRS